MLGFVLRSILIKIQTMMVKIDSTITSTPTVTPPAIISVRKCISLEWKAMEEEDEE